MKTVFGAWVERSGRSWSQLATALGVSESHLRNIGRGHRRPIYELAKRLSALTGGEISVEDLMEQKMVPTDAALAGEAA